MADGREAKAFPQFSSFKSASNAEPKRHKDHGDHGDRGEHRRHSKRHEKSDGRIEKRADIRAGSTYRDRDRDRNRDRDRDRGRARGIDRAKDRARNVAKERARDSDRDTGTDTNRQSTDRQDIPLNRSTTSEHDLFTVDLEGSSEPTFDTSYQRDSPFIVGLQNQEILAEDRSCQEVFTGQFVEDEKIFRNFKLSVIPFKIPANYIAESSQLGADFLLDDENYADQDMLDFLKSKQARLQETVDMNPTNVPDWLHLIHNRESIQQYEKLLPTASEVRSSIFIDAEIILSMYSKALRYNPINSQLIMDYMKLGSKIWPSGKETVSKWSKFALQNPSNIQLWISWIDSIFTAWAGSGLMNIIYDQIVTKQLIFRELFDLIERADNESDLAQRECLFVRVLGKICHSLQITGYREIAVGLIQAQLELNFFCPFQGSADNEVSQKRRLDSLGMFWNMECSRIGDIDAVGWKNTKENQILTHDTSDSAFSENRRDTPVDWFNNELLNTGRKQYPDRSVTNEIIGDEVEDPYRIVLFDDLRPFLRSLNSPSSRLELIWLGLSTIGADVSLEWNGQVDEDILVSQPRNLHLERTIKLLATSYECPSQIVCWFLRDLTARTDCSEKSFRNMAKSLLKLPPYRNDLKIWLEYASGHFKLTKDLISSRQIYETALGMVSSSDVNQGVCLWSNYVSVMMTGASMDQSNIVSILEHLSKMKDLQALGSELRTWILNKMTLAQQSENVELSCVFCLCLTLHDLLQVMLSTIYQQSSEIWKESYERFWLAIPAINLSRSSYCTVLQSLLTLHIIFKQIWSKKLLGSSDSSVLTYLRLHISQSVEFTFRHGLVCPEELITDSLSLLLVPDNLILTNSFLHKHLDQENDSFIQFMTRLNLTKFAWKKMMLESESGTNPPDQLIRNVYRQMVAGLGSRFATIWNSYLEFELSRETLKNSDAYMEKMLRIKELYLKAVQDCAWNKQILLQGLNPLLVDVITQDQRQRIYQIILEREMRIHVDPPSDYIDAKVEDRDPFGVDDEDEVMQLDSTS